MKLKNKKKILPILITLLLFFSLFASIISAVQRGPGIYDWGMRWNPDIEQDRRQAENSTNAWNISESFRDGTADENWNVSSNLSRTNLGVPWEVNDTRWNLNEFVASYDFNYSLMWNNSSGKAGNDTFHWALVNYSYMNRSQSVVFARAQNWTNEVYYGVIFKANNSTYNGYVDNMTAVLFGPQKCYILTYNNSSQTLWDTFNGTSRIITSNTSTGLTNYYSNAWVDNASLDGADGFYNGTWIKTIYNAVPGRIQSKMWGNNSTNGGIGFLDEPNGWIVDQNITNLTTITFEMYGLAVWNPTGENAVVQFDMLNTWRLNYTTNRSSLQLINGINHYSPHMDFPIINSSIINSSIMSIIWDPMSGTPISGNITMNSITDILIDLTQNMSLESRMYHPSETATPQVASSVRNDTIYYYSAMMEDFNSFAAYWFGTNPFAGNPDEILFLWIQDTTNYGGSNNTSLFVAFDTDNDGMYNVHDRAFMLNGTVSTLSSWTGNVSDATTNFFGDFASPRRGLTSMHRYNYYNNYFLMIPRTELPHTSNTSLSYLAMNDTFGLMIMTENPDWDDKSPVWCNWNESTGVPLVPENNDTVRNFYTNMSSLILPSSRLLINSTNVGRWGEGHIGWQSNPLKGNFSVNITKTANITAITSDLTATSRHIVNYSINVTNTGLATLTTVQINETWFNCTWSDFRINITSTNNIWNNTNTGVMWRWETANRSWNNASTIGYLLINITNLTSDNYFNISIQVNLTTCADATRGIATNWANVTCDQTDITDSDSHSIRWAATETLRIQALTSVFDVVALADSVITILGIVLIIGAIMAIVGLVYSYKDMW